MAEKITYEEALTYFERRKERTDLPDKCENAEDLAIEAIKRVVAMNNMWI